MGAVPFGGPHNEDYFWVYTGGRPILGNYHIMDLPGMYLGPDRG